MSASKETHSPPIELWPTLRTAIEGAGLDPANLSLAVEADGQRQLRLADKQVLVISDGNKTATWKVSSLAEMFRGDRLPPEDIEHYPEAYVPYFFFVEVRFLLLCDTIREPSDQEMEEIYAALRRRPDGRTISATHSAVWQIMALLLGHYVISETEFAGITSALLSSARRWAMRPISRFYIDYLRKNFS
jgi:hypothetical protein